MFDRFAPPDEPITIAHCEWCGREIYAGDEVKRTLIDGWRPGYVHAEECAEDYAFDRVYNAEGTITATLDVE
jgi:hypothetical protein